MTKFTEIGYAVEGIKFTGHNDKECLDFCPRARDPMDQKGNLILPTLVEEVLVNPGDWIVRNCFGHFRKFTDKELFENYTPLYNEALNSFYVTYAGPLEFVARSNDIPTINRGEIKTETTMVPLTLWRPVRGGNSGMDEMQHDREEGLDKGEEKEPTSTSQSTFLSDIYTIFHQNETKVSVIKELQENIALIKQELEQAYLLIRRVALELGGEMDQGVAAWWVTECGNCLADAAKFVYTEWVKSLTEKLEKLNMEKISLCSTEELISYLDEGNRAKTRIKLGTKEMQILVNVLQNVKKELQSRISLLFS